MALLKGKQLASAPEGIDTTNINAGAVTSAKLASQAVGAANLGAVAGNGLAGGLGSALSVQPADTSIAVTGGGIAVAFGTNPGLVTSGGVKINLQASSGLTTVAGLAVVPDPTNQTITVASTGVSVKNSTTGGLTAVAGGHAILLPAASGLQTTASGLSVLPNPTNATIAVASAGISVIVDPAFAIIAGASGLKVNVGTGILISTNAVTYDNTVILDKTSTQAGISGAKTFTGGITVTTTPITATAGVTGLPSPSAASDAATKSYVDAAIQGVNAKAASRASTTGALAANTYANGAAGVGATLTANANGALAAQDGVTLVVNDRLLVKNEATAANNGIYVVTQVGSVSLPYILTRATDEDTASEALEAFTFIEEGTLNADTGWLQITNAPITVGTTAQVWTQFSGAGSITAGNGLTKTGNTLDVTPGDTSLTATVGSLTVNLNTNGGLVTSSGVGINLAAASGLSLTANALAVKPNTTNQTIAVAAGGVSVITDPSATTGGLTANASGLAVNFGNGLTVSGSQLIANLDGTSIHFSGATIALLFSGTPVQFANAAAAGTGATAARIDHVHKRDTHQQDYFAVGSPVPQSTTSTYTLSQTPVQNLAVRFYLNGQLLEQGVGADYTVSSNVVTYLGGVALTTTDRFEAVYVSL